MIRKDTDGKYCEDKTKMREFGGNSRIISTSFVFGCVVNSRKFEPRPGMWMGRKVNFSGTSFKIVSSIDEGDEDGGEKIRDGDLKSDLGERGAGPD